MKKNRTRTIGNTKLTLCGPGHYRTSEGFSIMNFTPRIPYSPWKVFPPKGGALPPKLRGNFATLAEAVDALETKGCKQ